MKKTLTAIVLLSFLVACISTTPISTSVPSLAESTPPLSLTTGCPSTNTPLGEVITPSPQVSPVSGAVLNIPFRSTDWHFWFDYEGSPFSLTIDTQGEMWASVRDKVSYFDGEGWIPVNQDEMELSRLSQLHVADDGAIWVLGQKSQETYLAQHNGESWTEYILPDAIVASRLLRMAVDSTNQVWISAMDCYTGQCLFTFVNGIWQEERHPVHNQILGGVDVISDSEGHIWVSGGWYEGIAELLDNGWHSYPGEYFWAERPFVGFRSAEHISINAGLDGSMWAYLESSPWIIHLKRDDQIERLMIGLDVDSENLFYIILHESKQNQLWVGIDPRSDFSGQGSTMLGFFDGTHWVSFTGLPFELIYSIDETPDGVVLVLTENGLYRYEPH